MLGQKIETVNSFKYLGFTWTSKMSLKPTVNRCIENIQSSLRKLKWLLSSKILSAKVLRKCFFAYTFPHFAWIFPFFPFLPQTHQEALRRKFRVAIRLVHRAPFVSATSLFSFTHEDPLDNYVKRYILIRLKNSVSSDLGSSQFVEDILFWDTYNKYPKDGVEHYFSLKRVKRLKANHHVLLLDWLEFVN